ncbi:hypothetical protein WDW86_20190 [Bdellovibrionota bacterium FG-2]
MNKANLVLMMGLLGILGVLGSGASFAMGKNHFSHVSKEGVKILSSMIAAREWRLSREGELVGSAGEKPVIAQKLQLFVSNRPDLLENTNVDQVHLLTEAEAFGSVTTMMFISNSYKDYVYGETIYPAIQESTECDGSYRFLLTVDPKISIDGADWFNKKLSVAAVDPLLMNSTEKVSLYPDDKVCSGANCRALNGVNLTQAVFPKYVVLELNPKIPDQLKVEIYNGEFSEQPTFTFQYQTSDPLPPPFTAELTLCTSYSEIQLRAARPGFKCRISSWGANVYERVAHPGFGESWKTPDGMIWGDVLAAADQPQAAQICEKLGGRLPTRDDVKHLWQFRRSWEMADGGTGYNPYSMAEIETMLPHMKQRFWTQETSTYIDVFSKARYSNDEGIFFTLSDHYWEGNIFPRCVANQ